MPAAEARFVRPHQEGRVIDIKSLQASAGAFCEIELTDGFSAYVWVNAVDPTFATHEVNVDVITLHALGSRRDADIPLDGPWTVNAAEIVRLDRSGS